MKNQKICVIILALVAISCSQNIIINSGCKSFTPDGSSCLECSFRFYSDVNGICQPVSQSCSTFDAVSGECLSCYDGYALNEGACLRSVHRNADPFCNKFVNNACVKCSSGFYFDSNKACTRIDPMCKQFDEVALICVGCYSGYVLNGTTCIIDTNPSTIVGCKNTSNGTCIQCSDRYFNLSGVCTEVSTDCQTYNSTTGYCLSCYNGFQLANDTCIKSNANLIDLYCAAFNNSKCIRCSQRTYMNSANTCTPVDPLCKGYDSTSGACTSCFISFKLVNNTTCQIDSTLTVVFPNCSKFQNNVCVKCSYGFYFDSQNNCIQSDPECKSYDFKNLICSECYIGFALSNGSCISNNISIKADANCQTFNANNTCKSCSYGFYFDSNRVCVQVDSSCKAFNYTSLKCVECYTGFIINSTDICVLDVNATNCAEFLKGVCIRCVDRAYYDLNNNCVKVNDNCKTYQNFTGFCLSCYGGYELDSNKQNCIYGLGLGCAKSDSNGTCLECYKGTYLSNDSKCIFVDNQCANFDYEKKICTSCVKGSQLVNGRCMVAAILIYSDLAPNCLAYDTNYECTQCLNRYYLANRSCNDVDPLCKTYDQATGACKSCYSSYTLTQGSCL